MNVLNCHLCKILFTKKYYNQKYCTSDCRNKRYRSYKTQWQQEKREQELKNRRKPQYVKEAYEIKQRVEKAKEQIVKERLRKKSKFERIAEKPVNPGKRTYKDYLKEYEKKRDKYSKVI